MSVVNRSGYAISPEDGSPIFYRVHAGPSAPSAPAVMLCDGVGCDGYVWKYLRATLTERFDVVHWHYRGHGRTPRPRDPRRVGIADHADDAAAVLDDMGAERAILFGHSMGVQVALETFRRHRERVAGLVLICGAPENPLKTFRGSSAMTAVLPILRRTVGRAPRLFSGLTRTVLPTRALYRVASAVEINAELVDESDFMPYLLGLSRIDPELFLAMVAEAGRHSAIDLLPHIDVPALVVAGERDGFTPPELSLAMSKAIPRAELLVVHGGSHTAPLERPDLVNKTVLEFLTRRVAPGPRSPE